MEGLRVAPSYYAVTTQEDNCKQELLQNLTVHSSAIESTDVSEIKQAITTIKKIKDKYTAASQQLSSWHIKNGSYDAAREIRNTRLDLVHKDCSEFVKSLNARLHELGEDVTSSIGAPSVLHEMNTMNRLTHQSVLGNRTINEEIANKNESLHPSCDDPPSPAASSHHSSPSPSENEVFISQRMSNVCFNDRQPIRTQPDSSKIESQNAPHPMQSERLDPVTRQQLKQDLLRGLGDPFDGTPTAFWPWQQQISTRLLESECSALDSLHILQAEYHW